MKTNKHNYFYSITLLLIACGLWSCQSLMTPLQVSEKFWTGIQKKNIALVKTYSLSNSGYESDEMTRLPDVTAISFGKIIIDADIAEIETRVTIASNEKTIEIPLKTYLKNENNIWRVSYEKSVLPLKTNQEMTKLLGDMQELTEGIAEEIEESVEEFKDKTLPEIKSKLEQAEQELREKLPELKNKIDEFLRDLEKSLEEAFPAEEEAKTQQT